MDIREQFNLTAKQYDENRRNFIPCFDEFYFGSTNFIIDYISQPNHILDLGTGTGLLSEIWHNKLPNSHYVLIDIAEEMLEVARVRFTEASNVSFEICDYTERLPRGNFDAVISGLSIHHIEDSKKRELFSQIYAILPEGGIFVNYDQFCAKDKSIDAAYEEYWLNFIKSTDAAETEIEKAGKRRKLDIECSVEQEIEMLKEAGFSTECVYKNKKFAVMLSIKR